MILPYPGFVFLSLKSCYNVKLAKLIIDLHIAKTLWL